MSPAVAESLEKGQHGWFVEENAKLSTKKFEAWAADTPEGRDFMDLASQQFAAERQVRIREVCNQGSRYGTHYKCGVYCLFFFIHFQCNFSRRFM